MLYIKNGTVIDPVNNRLCKADLEIRDGRIARIIERNMKEPEAFNKEMTFRAGTALKEDRKSVV